MIPLPLFDLLAPGPALLLHTGAEGHGHINIWLLVAVGLVGNGVYFTIAGPGMLVGRAVRDALSRVTGLPVELDELRLPLRRDALAFQGLRIENPAGFDGEALMTIHRGTAPLSARSALDRSVAIPHLTLDGVEIHIERNTAGSNLAPVLASLRHAAESPEAGEGSGARRVRIEEVRVSGIQLHLLDAPGEKAAAEGTDSAETTVSIPVDDLRIEPRSDAEDAGIPLDRLCALVLLAVLEAAAARTSRLT